MNEANDFYRERLVKLNVTFKKAEKRSFMLYILRLLLFGMFLLYLTWLASSHANLISILCTMLSIGAFLAAIKIHMGVLRHKQNVLHRIRINENELRYIGFEFENFEAGDDIVSSNIELATDFDLFGTGSVYQYISRASTHEGRRKFASKLTYWDKEVFEIELKQGAIRELASNPGFMEDFQALGMSIENDRGVVQKLGEWLDEPHVVGKYLRVVLIAYPFALLALFTLAVLTKLPFSIILLPLVIGLLLVTYYIRKVNVAHEKLGSTAKHVEQYSGLIKLVEGTSFRSEYLLGLKHVFLANHLLASQRVMQLFRLLNSFDFRLNFLANILLNSTMLFDLQMLSRLEKWKELNRKHVLNWFDSLAEIDAILGFARYSFNCAESTSYPVIRQDVFCISARALGHPLIPYSHRVCNDVELFGQPKTVVVTGANMAGKSTFLRTLAVNLILAHNGSPVCAKGFVFAPCYILSSINIRDSLAQNQSYFYAELLRIQRIIAHAEREPRTVVILDEILRGTNSKDKQAGTLGLLEKLMSLSAFTVIATHDLSIGNLADKYPNIVENFCFEVELENDELVFDYRLKDGVSKKLNASFLMKKMGVIG